MSVTRALPRALNIRVGHACLLTHHHVRVGHTRLSVFLTVTHHHHIRVGHACLSVFPSLTHHHVKVGDVWLSVFLPPRPPPPPRLLWPDVRLGPLDTETPPRSCRSNGPRPLPVAATLPHVAFFPPPGAPQLRPSHVHLTGFFNPVYIACTSDTTTSVKFIRHGGSSRRLPPSRLSQWHVTDTWVPAGTWTGSEAGGV